MRDSLDAKITAEIKACVKDNKSSSEFQHLSARRVKEQAFEPETKR